MKSISEIKFLHIGMSVGDNGHAKGLRQAFPNYSEINVADRDLNLQILHTTADLVFIQKQDTGISSQALQHLRNNGAFIINWTGDVRHKIPPYIFEYASNVNLTCFSNQQDVDTMRKLDWNSEFLQIGYDPEIYYPYDCEKDIDIVFMGNNVGGFPLSSLRMQMVAELKATYGNRFKAYGIGMPDGNYMGNQMGEADIYRRAKIGINLSHFDRNRYTSDRMFRMLGCGICVLSHKFKEVEKDFDGLNNLILWSDLSGLKMYIDDFLYNEPKRKSIAESGHQLAINNTFYHMGLNIYKLYTKYAQS